MPNGDGVFFAIIVALGLAPHRHLCYRNDSAIFQTAAPDLSISRCRRGFLESNRYALSTSSQHDQAGEEVRLSRANEDTPGAKDDQSQAAYGAASQCRLMGRTFRGDCHEILARRLSALERTAPSFRSLHKSSVFQVPDALVPPLMFPEQ
jgi:hypothetical protein